VFLKLHLLSAIQWAKALSPTFDRDYYACIVRCARYIEGVSWDKLSIADQLYDDHLATLKREGDIS